MVLLQVGMWYCLGILNSTIIQKQQLKTASLRLLPFNYAAIMAIVYIIILITKYTIIIIHIIRNDPNVICLKILIEKLYPRFNFCIFYLI